MWCKNNVEFFKTVEKFYVQSSSSPYYVQVRISRTCNADDTVTRDENDLKKFRNITLLYLSK